MKNKTLSIFTKEQVFFLHNEMCINVAEFENELCNLFKDEAWKFKCIMDFFLSSSVREQLHEGCNNDSVYEDMEMFIEKYKLSLSVEDDRKYYYRDLFNYYFSNYYHKGLKEVFTSREPNLNGPRIYLDKKLSSDEELEHLPNEITIYRGMSRKEYNNGSFGQSWSLREAVAVEFANKNSYTDDTLVVKKVINKSQVLLLYMGRMEDEIVVKNGTITSGAVVWEKRIEDAPK